MKILVTGATGFVGSHLCERLTELGHTVYALARSQAKFEHYQVPGKLVLGKLVHDENHPWIDQLPSDLDAVVHTAGIVHSYNKDEFSKINAGATEQLIKDLKARYTNLKFVLISSLAATGPTVNKIHRKEEHKPKPTSEYGRSKLLAEEVLTKNAPESWNKIVIRPPMVIGPRDPAVLDIFKMVKSGVIFGPGLGSREKLYSYVCVYDLVEVIRRALESTTVKDETFFASHQDQITMNELITMIKKKMDKKRTVHMSMPMPMLKTLAGVLEKMHRIRPINARLTPDKIHELQPSAWTCSPEKSQKLLDMTYGWDLENTIEITLEDYQKRGWV